MARKHGPNARYTKSVQFMVTPQEEQNLYYLCAKHKMTRSEFLRALLRRAIAEDDGRPVVVTRAEEAA